MRFAAITFIALLMAFGGCAATPGNPKPTTQEPGRDSPPMGHLGHPIGTYLKIEGVRAVHGKAGERALRVDTVDDQALADPVGVWIDNVSQLPLGERCVLRGFESARWIGTPPEVVQATGLVGQAKWQLHRFFMATSVDTPRSLIIE